MLSTTTTYEMRVLPHNTYTRSAEQTTHPSRWGIHKLRIPWSNALGLAYKWTPSLARQSRPQMIWLGDCNWAILQISMRKLQVERHLGIPLWRIHELRVRYHWQITRRRIKWYGLTCVFLSIFAAMAMQPNKNAPYRFIVYRTVARDSFCFQMSLISSGKVAIQS